MTRPIYYKKPLLQLMAPESVHPGEKYSFSFNVSKEILTNDYVTNYNQYCTFMKPFNDIMQYELYPELAPSGQFHLHGHVSFKTYKDIGLFYMKIFKYPHSIQLGTEFEEGPDYPIKQNKINEAMCEHYELSYVISNLTNPTEKEYVQTALDIFYKKRPKRRTKK